MERAGDAVRQRWSLLCLWSIARALAANAPTGIIVEGNRRVDAATVQSYFHSAADGRYDAASLDAALKG